MNKGKFSFFNYIRVIATLCVFAEHTLMAAMAHGYEITVRNFFLRPGAGAVWTFFILSGYLAGLGYSTGRYKQTVKGVLLFYFQRIFKILIPTLLVILLICFFVSPEQMYGNTAFFRSLFTLTYNGDPDIAGTGLSWYIFTLMWLYFIAPFLGIFFTWLRKKFSNPKTFNIVLIVFAVVLGIAGLWYRYYMTLVKYVDWYTVIYLPPYSQLDLFIGAFALSYLTIEKPMKHRKWFPPVSILIYLGIYLLDAWLLFKDHKLIYMLTSPTLILLYLGIFVVLNKRFELGEYTDKLPLLNRVVTWFAGISLGFYLLHAAVLYRINSVTAYLDGVAPQAMFLRFLIPACIICLILSVGFQWIVKGIGGIEANLKKKLFP